MNIEKIKIQQNGYLVNGSISVPNDENNRHFKMVQKAIANGIVVEPEFTQEEMSSKQEEVYKNLIQTYLDATANSWGYDSIYTAIGYIGDPNDTFNKEGLMFRNWRSAVWTYVNEELAKLKQGLRTMPTEEEAIAELPLLDTYRTQQGL